MNNSLNKLIHPSLVIHMASLIQQLDVHSTVNRFTQLGEGYELRPIDLTEEELENDRLVDMKYSNLYHNGLKVSNEIFRKGGTGGKFKDGYCELIQYERTTEPKKNSGGFSFGKHVIINNLGEIKLEADGTSYPRHVGGNIGALNERFYDLRTGVVISPTGKYLIGESCIILEHSYNWQKDSSLPVGLYKIDMETAEITQIDKLRK